MKNNECPVTGENLAKHMFHSMLGRDVFTGIKIISLIQNLPSEQLGIFLASLGGCMEGFMSILESVPQYRQKKKSVMEALGKCDYEDVGKWR